MERKVSVMNWVMSVIGVLKRVMSILGVSEEV